MYYYNLYKDPANKGAFEATFGEDYKRIMDEMISNMDEKVKEFADWQVNEFYPALYEHYNKTYKALYRTNMPWNRFYAGMIYRNDPEGNAIEQEPLDMLSDKSIMNTSVGASSTKFRTQNNLGANIRCRNGPEMGAFTLSWNKSCKCKRRIQS